MCCFPSDEGEEAFQKWAQGKKKIIGYKTFRVNGAAGLSGHTTGKKVPDDGVLAPKLPKDFLYDPNNPKGIHVYLFENRPPKNQSYVPVQLDVKDFICCDNAWPTGYGKAEAVFRKATILPKDRLQCLIKDVLDSHSWKGSCLVCEDADNDMSLNPFLYTAEVHMGNVADAEKHLEKQVAAIGKAMKIGTRKLWAMPQMKPLLQLRKQRAEMKAKLTLTMKVLKIVDAMWGSAKAR